MMKSVIFSLDNSRILRRAIHFTVTFLGILFLPVAEMLPQTYWTPLPRPTHHDLRKLSFLDSLNGWVAGDSGTILRTTSGGASWIQQNSGVTEDIRSLFMMNEQKGWAIAPWVLDTTYATILLSTTNGGDVWQNQLWSGEYLTCVYFTDSLHGWLGSASGRIFATTNSGLTWTELGRLFSPILNLKFLSSVYGFAMGGILDLAGAVVRTTDRGASWSAQNVAPDPVYDLHFFDSLNIIGVFGGGAGFVGIVTTNNGGNSWALRVVGTWGEPLALAVRTPAEMWLPMGRARTYMYTLDSGATWMTVNMPDTTEVYDAVFTDEQAGYMVGSEGTVLRYNFVTSIGETQQRHPLQYMLHQNYPNPFNPVTVIRYTLPVTSLVNLKVYNLLGQEVATLVNEEMKPGTYNVTWDASSSCSGMYFCRLTAGNFVETKKLILLE
jgi:photosystem II stability/assembly factor-like uncharacterized protein